MSEETNFTTKTTMEVETKVNEQSLAATGKRIEDTLKRSVQNATASMSKLSPDWFGKEIPRGYQALQQFVESIKPSLEEVQRARTPLAGLSEGARNDVIALRERLEVYKQASTELKKLEEGARRDYENMWETLLREREQSEREQTRAATKALAEQEKAAQDSAAEQERIANEVAAAREKAASLGIAAQKAWWTETLNNQEKAEQEEIRFANEVAKAQATAARLGAAAKIEWWNKALNERDRQAEEEAKIAREESEEITAYNDAIKASMQALYDKGRTEAEKTDYSRLKEQYRSMERSPEHVSQNMGQELSGARGAVAGFANAHNIPGLYTAFDKLAGGAERAKEALSGIAPKLTAIAKAGAGLGLNAIGNHFKKLGAIVTKVGSIFTRFGRVLVWRLYRMAAMKALQAITQGFKNLNSYSKTFGTQFHESVTRLKASAQYLANAFAAMVAPIVNAVTPALEKLMDTLAELANRVGQVIATILGQEQYSAAIKHVVNESEKASKKMKDLFGFDEINRLSGDNDTGDDTSKMFTEWGTLDNASFGGDLGQIGEMLAEKINNAVANIDAEGIAAKIAEKINNVIALVGGLIKNIDFKAIGSKVGEFLNKLLEDIDWKGLGEIVAAKVLMLPSFLIGLFEKLDFKTIGSAIGKYLSGLWGYITDWINNIDWVQLGSDIVRAVVDLIKGLDSENILTTLWKLVKAVVGGVVELAIGLFKGLAEAIGEIPFVQKIGEAFNGVVDWVDTNIIQPTQKFFSDFWDGVTGFFKDPVGTLKKAWEGVSRTLKELWNSIIDELDLLPDSWKEKLKFTIPVETELDTDSAEDTRNRGQTFFNNNPLDEDVKVYEHGRINKEALHSKLAKYFGNNPETSTVLTNADSASLTTAKAAISSVANPKNGWKAVLQTSASGLGTTAAAVSGAVSGIKKGNPIKLATSATGLSTTATSVTDKVSSINKDKNNKVKIATSLSTKGLPTSLSNVWDSLQGGLNKNPLTFATSVVGSGVTSTITSAVRNMMKNALKAIGFAEGGSVMNNGSLILAGEAGPEVVANMGNRTGVMNVDQMEAAVANGNIPVVNAIYAVLSAVNSIDPNVYLDSQKIGESVTRYQNNQARRGIPRMV